MFIIGVYTFMYPICPIHVLPIYISLVPCKQHVTHYFIYKHDPNLGSYGVPYNLSSSTYVF